MLPQLFIAPRGLITVLLFYAIPREAQIDGFESGILLFVIISTSLVMTWAMIRDKQKIGTILDEIDEEILERNLAEDILHEHESKKESQDIESRKTNGPTDIPRENLENGENV